MDVRVYTLEDLVPHMQAMYSRENTTCPLSPLRLQSYLHNPRARTNDPVLFELWQEDRLVAYRSLLPDHYADRRGKMQPFAWFSGNWVDTDFRRKGYSTKLLREVEARWQGRLMYTNYAPASKAVYDRSGKFPLLMERKGKRFYLRAAAEELLGDRLGSRNLLRFGDQAVNLFRERKLEKFEDVDQDLCQIKQLSRPDPQTSELINRLQQVSLFRRDTEVFNWILDHPWVTEDASHPVNYQFSYQSRRFKNILLSFILPDQSRGFLWLLLHNQALSVPYLFSESEGLYPHMARRVLHYLIRHQCAYTTIRHAALAEHLASFRSLFLHIRDMPQRFFAHEEIAKEIARDREIQDGDGDVVFTG
jgi:hypothetical protein